MTTRAHVALGSASLLAFALLLCRGAVSGQDGARQWDGVPPVLVEDVTRLHGADEPDIVVRVVARGLSDASSFAFLPGGEILVTEK